MFTPYIPLPRNGVTTGDPSSFVVCRTVNRSKTTLNCCATIPNPVNAKANWLMWAKVIYWGGRNEIVLCATHAWPITNTISLYLAIWKACQKCRGAAERPALKDKLQADTGQSTSVGGCFAPVPSRLSSKYMDSIRSFNRHRLSGSASAA